MIVCDVCRNQLDATDATERVLFRHTDMKRQGDGAAVLLRDDKHELCRKCADRFFARIEEAWNDLVNPPIVRSL